MFVTPPELEEEVDVDDRQELEREARFVPDRYYEWSKEHVVMETGGQEEDLLLLQVWEQVVAQVTHA